MIERPVVYRHFAEDGELLYVGASLCGMRRQYEHCMNSSWFELVASIHLAYFETASEMLAAEKAAIQSERPKHNIAYAIDDQGKRLTRRPPVFFKPSQYVVTREQVAVAERLATADIKAIANTIRMSKETLEKILIGRPVMLSTVAKLTAYFKKYDRKVKP